MYHVLTIMETPGEAQHNRQQLILQERAEPNFDSAGDPTVDEEVRVVDDRHVSF